MMKWVAAACGCMTAVMLGYIVLVNSSAMQDAQVFSTAFLPQSGKSADSAAPPPASQVQVAPVAPAPSAERQAASKLRVFSTKMPLYRPQAYAGDATQTAASQPPKPRRWTFRIVGSSSDVPRTTAAANPAAQSGLTRQIQREIKRVGCGNVSITGYWDQRTRRATARFVANRNASLPTNGPDVVLLSLLRNYVGTACGRTCSGYFDTKGRCIASRTVKLAPQQPDLSSKPKIVERPRADRIISGWAPRTVAQPQQPVNRGRGSTSSGLGVGRMALGARPASTSPGAPPAVTVAPQNYGYGGTSNTYGFGSGPVQPVEVVRPPAIGETLERTRVRAKRTPPTRRVQRRTRRKTSWKQKVHFGLPEN